MTVVIRLILGLVILACLALAGDIALDRITAERLYRQSGNQYGFQKLVQIKQAINLAPENYRYVLARAHQEKELGRTKSWQVTLKQAITLRPSWPHVWQELLESYALGKNFSEEFDTALHRSSLLGHNSSHLAWQRIELGFDVPDKDISDNSRPVLQNELRRAFRSNRNKVLGYAIFTENIDHVCNKGLLEVDDELEAWCKGSRWFVRICMNDKPKKKAVQSQCKRGLRYWWRQTQSKFRLLPDLDDSAGKS